VLHSDNVVRITARIIDAVAEKQLWAETYNRQVREILALQGDAVSSIARVVRVKVTSKDEVGLTKSRPVNADGYDAYLRGRYFWNKRTPQELTKSIEHFREAIDKDPTYAPAHAGLADAYALLGSIGYDAMPPGKRCREPKAPPLPPSELTKRWPMPMSRLGT
jgi:hypothetical protein